MRAIKEKKKFNEEVKYRELLSKLFQEGVIDTGGKLKKHNN